MSPDCPNYTESYKNKPLLAVVVVTWKKTLSSTQMILQDLLSGRSGEGAGREVAYLLFLYHFYSVPSVYEKEQFV